MLGWVGALGTRSDLIEVLAADYGISRPSLSAFYEDRERAVYRVHHSGAPYVVRWFPPARSLKRVEADATVLRALRHLDIERLVETADGRGCSASGQRGVIVTHLIQGLASPTDHHSLRRIGATLAGVGEVEINSVSKAAPQRRARSLPREDLSAAIRWLDEIETHVPSGLRNLFDRLRRDVEGTSDCETAPLGLLHPDCHPGNVILSPTGPVLFDWEGAGVGPLVASLGWLLFSASVASPTYASPGVDYDAVEAVLTGYTSVRHLTTLEINLLEHALRFRPLVVACRQLRDAVRTADPCAAAGWWSRYVEAEQVAAWARV